MLRFKLCSTRSASEAACLRKSVGATHRYTTAPAVGRITLLAQVRRAPRRGAQPHQSRAPHADRSPTPLAAASMPIGPGVSLTATRANRTAALRFFTLATLPTVGVPSASSHWPVRRSTRRHRYAASASKPSRRAYSATDTPEPCHPRQRSSHIALIVARCSRVNIPSS